MNAWIVSAALGFVAPPGPPPPPPPSVPITTAPQMAQPARLSKGRRLVLGAGIAYGLGAAITWGTAAAAGTLDEGSRTNQSAAMVPYALGMIVGGAGQMEGVLLSAIGSKQLARERPGRARRARPLRAGGGVLLGLGATAAVGTGIMWPTLRERCPIGIGCGLAAIEIGGAAMAVGAGMLSFGKTSRPHSDRRAPLPKRIAEPLIGGTTATAMGYFSSSLVGMLVWQANPEDPGARRIRNRMVIPVVGPWITAAGPDAPLPFALAASCLGALQIGGAIALLVGAGRAAHHRRKPGRGYASVVPTGTGIALVGEF